MDWRDSETITVQGRDFAVLLESDEDYSREPWNEFDGNGIISEWTSRGKHAGERVIARDGSRHRFYDFAATIRKAKIEGWDTAPDGIGTRGEKALRAVEADFDRWRRFLSGDWEYIGVIVAPIDYDENDEPIIDDSRVQSLWGIESDGNYWREVATELAEEIIAIDQTETDERRFAQSLGIATVGAA